MNGTKVVVEIKTKTKRGKIDICVRYGSYCDTREVTVPAHIVIGYPLAIHRRWNPYERKCGGKGYEDFVITGANGLSLTRKGYPTLKYAKAVVDMFVESEAWPVIEDVILGRIEQEALRDIMEVVHDIIRQADNIYLAV